MSRTGHGYCLDNWAIIKWRGIVASSIRGSRGQSMLKELLAALDAMPKKELITDQVVSQEGDCCAIGALLLAKEPPYLPTIQGERDQDFLYDWNGEIAEDLDIAVPLVQEIEYMNDSYGPIRETPSERWHRMREWVAGKIKKEDS